MERRSWPTRRNAQTLDAAQVAEQLTLADRQRCEALLIQAEAADDDRAFRLPRELAGTANRHAKLKAAQEALQARAAPKASAPNVNLTDSDSRLMPSPKGGFIQGYNA